MSLTRSTVFIEYPFILSYMDGNAMKMTSFATEAELDTFLEDLGNTEYISAIPTLIGSEGAYTDIASLHIKFVINLSSDERAKLHDDETGTINGDLVEVADGDSWYVSQEMDVEMVGSSYNYKNYMLIPDGCTTSNTLVELFDAITTAAGAHTDDQAVFTSIYEYIICSIALYTVSSPTFNPYMYNYVIQSNIEDCDNMLAMRAEFDSDVSRIIQHVGDNSASNEATWRNFLNLYLASQALYLPSVMLCRFILNSWRYILDVKDTSGQQIEFFTSVNNSGRDLMDGLDIEDSSIMIRGMHDTLSTAVSGLNNVVIRMADTLGTDINTVFSQTNSNSDDITTLQTVLGVGGIDSLNGVDLISLVIAMKAQLDNIYTTLRLNQV